MVSEVIYNVRRYANLGRLFPRFLPLMTVCLVLIAVLSFWFIHAERLSQGTIALSVGAIPGLLVGFSADPKK